MGFLRSIRSEEIDKRIVTLIIHQSDKSQSNGIAELVTSILYSSFNNSRLSVRDGIIMIGHMVHERQLDEKRRSFRHPQEQIGPWLPGPPLALAVGQTGMLDSLRFVEDQSYSEDLASDEVEIEAVVWPISLRDVLIVLGKIGFGDGLGYECAGTVSRVGLACSEKFQPGDRVSMGVLGSMRSHPRGKARCVRKLPDHLSFEEAVSTGNPCMTAWHGLINIARLQKGEKVLIHSAAGATGQMAVQIAQLIGATIFATVGSDEKRELLVKEFGIPKDHIFNSRDVSFAKEIKRVTEGRGVDVILNSLSGDSLQASWECIAPYGRFIEIGKADIMDNSLLPMSMFAKNVIFAAVDLAEVARTNIPLEDALITKTLELTADKLVFGPRPSHMYSVAETEKAFRFMQSGKNTGRIMIARTENDNVTKHLVHKSTWSFNPDASYVVVGGLGGLGREILKWMVGKGAKNLLILSRSGASSPAASDLISSLRKQGIRIETPYCDVSSATELSKALENYTTSVPHAPIKGCINSAMHLQDAMFINMTHEKWTRTIQSKVHTSWNLHALLPRDLDFFILLSSLVGIYGAMGQSNYAAGCTFQDALARARAEASAYQGVSLSLNLSWVVDAGIVSEREDYRRKWEMTQGVTGVQVADLLAVLDHYCDPATRSTLATAERGSTGATGSRYGQLLIGAVTPMDSGMIHGRETIASQMNRPLFKAFMNMTDNNNAMNATASENVAFGVRFRAASSQREQCEIVVEALKEKLARALGVGPEDVDASRPVTAYGVDSLMAVELRNWILKDFGVEVLVFEILAGASISKIGEIVTKKTEEMPKETEGKGSHGENEER
ncbi:KR domain-containing protein [Xylaria curta]|nr:KR domain-containing protein [Xylaria curta]